MKWKYAQKKKLFEIFRKHAEESAAWDEYLDRIGCIRVAREGFAFRMMEKGVPEWTHFSKRLCKKGHVMIASPTSSPTHVPPPRDKHTLCRIILVPEELAERIIVLGALPP
jgi:hypothetical protein